MISKEPHIIMTAQDFIKRAKTLAARRTYYKNKYPYNLCYVHSDGRTSADCVNLYKAILNGYDVNNTTVGYYQRDLSNTGDCTEAELLAQCSDVSQDFTDIMAPEILYMKGHIGAYIGPTTRDGITYNVIECTASWGGGILYSWVDPDGTRRRSKGGNKNGRWTHHGVPSKWVSYGEEPAKPKTEPKKTNEEIAKEVLAGKWGNGVDRKSRLTAAGYDYNAIQKIVNDLCKNNSQTAENPLKYTVKKGDTLSGIARAHKTTIKALMALNPEIKDPNKIKAGQVLRIK